MIDSVWVYLIPVVVLAGLVRGYTGFGFASVAIVGMNLLLDPQQSVPVILCLDVLCSAPLLRQAIHQGDMPTFCSLTAGSLLGIPLGLGLLLLVPSESLKLGICILILFVCLLLALNIRFGGTERLSTRLGFGIFAGTATAASSVGGPIVVSYMISSSLSSMAQRGTMILFFVVSELLALGALFSTGLVDGDVLTLTLQLLLTTLLAVRGGQYLFNRRPPSSFKYFALPTMAMGASLGISASFRELF